MRDTIKRFVKFAAVVFPGGYKFFAVMLIVNFSEARIAESFSKDIFWVLLILTFSGMPLASMMSSRTDNLSNKQKYGAVLISTSFIIVILHLFFLKSEDLISILNITFAAVLISIYEFIRKDFFNLEMYWVVFKSGFISSVLMLIQVFALPESNEYLLVLLMLYMILPLWLVHVTNFKTKNHKEEISNKKQIYIFLQYALSNAFSTSLSAAIPLVLIYEMGSEYSVIIVKVVFIARLMLMVPRAMAASNIPKLRKCGPVWSVVKPYCKLLKIYFYTATIISLVVFLYYDSKSAIVFFILIVGLQLTQLALPYSNVLAVEGRAKDLLMANIKGTLIFMTLTLPIYIILEQGYGRGFSVLMIYLMHNYFKFKFTRDASIHLIR